METLNACRCAEFAVRRPSTWPKRGTRFPTSRNTIAPTSRTLSSRVPALLPRRKKPGKDDGHRHCSQGMRRGPRPGNSMPASILRRKKSSTSSTSASGWQLTPIADYSFPSFASSTMFFLSTSRMTGTSKSAIRVGCYSDADVLLVDDFFLLNIDAGIELRETL